MRKTPVPTKALTLRAGPRALEHVRERGLRPEDVEIVPGASGGPKWLVLEALDRFLFGDFLQRPSLPLGRIPDRGDFKRMPDEERIRVRRRVVGESERLSYELRALLESGRIADAAKPL